MTPIDPITFARMVKPPAHETCGGFVVRWLEAVGLRAARTPTPAELMQTWRKDGVLGGAENWFALMGLERCAPGPYCVAVAEQDGGGPLVGVIRTDGRFVACSFGKLAAKAQPRIIAAWRIPGAPGV
jgi:hypothetical protein